MKMRNFSSKQAGQAATEFLVAAVFLVVPLFIIIPLLGKYIDIKHAAIGQARYSTWEHSVWKNYNASLFFGDPHAADYGNPNKTVPLNPLWRDHRELPLFAMNGPPVSIKNEKIAMPLATVGELAGGLFDFVELVLKTFGKLLHDLRVDANADFFDRHGYCTSDLTLHLRPLDQILPRSALSGMMQAGEACGKNPAGGNCLTMRARAAVLTDDWNAGSPEHADRRSRGMVPTAVLSPLSTIVNGVIDPVNNVLSHIGIKLPVAPKFGHVANDLIPYEHRYGNTRKLQEKTGLSSYEKQ